MRLTVGFALLFSVALLHCCISEARSIDSSNSLEILLRVLLGGRGGGGTSEADGSESADESVRTTLEALQQHVAAVAANISSLEQIDTSLQQIQDMAEDTHTVQENILEYLGLEGEAESGSGKTGQPTRKKRDTRTPLPVLTGDEEINLEEGDTYTIRHPENGGSYNGNERFSWVFRSEDPNVVGFRIDTISVSVEGCCDKITIPTPDCHFPEVNIISTAIGPVFLSGPEINITFTSDRTINNDGFTLEVSTISDTDDTLCPDNEKYLSLDQNSPRLEIVHPEDGGDYENLELYVWIIKNEDPEAVGFEVTFDKRDFEKCCDVLKIEGDQCSYGQYTTLTKQSVTIRGDTMNITWTSYFVSTGSGFILGVSSLYELNKTECFDYICDEAEEHCFKFYDEPLTWNEGKAACEAEGGRLAMITDRQFEVFIRNSVDPAFFFDSWIGISGDSLSNMEWVTGQSTDAYGYENWRGTYNWYFEKYDMACGVFYAIGWIPGNCNTTRTSLCEKIQ